MSDDRKHYIVTLHRHEDLEDFYQDMETPGGSLYIPNRAIELINRRPTSRNTHYYLTDKEAETLKNDPRVWDVSMNPEDMGVLRLNSWSQSGVFNSIPTLSSHLNWALLYCTSESTIPEFEDFGSGQRNTTVTRPLSGRKVDVVNGESTIKKTHAEFAVNTDGTGGTRFQEINWYGYGLQGGIGLTESTFVWDYSFMSDHATACSGLAAGNRQGWARDALIYSMGNPSAGGYDLNTSSYTNKIDYVRQYHNWKKNNPDSSIGRARPTVFHESTNAAALKSVFDLNTGGPGGAPASVVARGVTYTGPWTFDPAGLEYDPKAWKNSSGFSLHDMGLRYLARIGSDVDESKNYRFFVPTALTAENADLQDAINDGVICFWSAGNTYRRIVNPAHVDYNNTMTIGGIVYYTNRFEYSTAGVIVVGNMRSNRVKSPTSVAGPGIDLWAPGDLTFTAGLDNTTTIADPRGLNNDKLQAFGGTSGACPVAAGIAASLAEVWPSATNATMKAYLQSAAKSGRMIDIAEPSPQGLWGASTATIFFPDITFTITRNQASVTNGQTVTYTIVTTNLPNGSVVYLKENGTAGASVFSDGLTQIPVTINNNGGSVTRVVATTYSGSSTSTLQLRTGGYDGTLQATASSVAVTGNYTPPVPTYNFGTIPSSINEGSAGTFNVVTTNVANGTTLYWTVQTNTGDFATISGSVNINNNSGSFTITPTADLTLEGVETFTVALRTSSTSGTIVATSSSVTINDTSVPTYSFTSIPSSINEGTSGTFIVSTTGVANGTTLYWSVAHGTSSGGDFDSLSGAFTISNGSGSFAISPSADFSSGEGAETFTVEVRTGSISGTVVATSSSVTINDSSILSYTFTSVPPSVSEGGAASFVVSTTGVANGTSLYWTLVPVTTGTSDFDALTGTITVLNNSASFVVNPIADNLTEGSEAFRVFLRTDSVFGPIVASTANVIVNDTSLSPPTYSFNTVPATIAEDAAGIFSVSTTNLSDGTILYWTINHGTTGAADFAGNNGTVTIVNNAATFSIVPIADFTTEGQQTFTVSLRTGSLVGPVVATTGTVTVLDVSQNATFNFSSLAPTMLEGTSYTVGISTTNVPVGTILYWTVNNVSTVVNDFSAASGFFVVTVNAGSFVVTPTADFTTEGSETFTLSVRTGSINGPVVATSSSVTIIDSSLTPTYAITNLPAELDEGSTTILVVETINVPNSTEIYWNINHGTTTSSDFITDTGSFTISNNISAFTIIVLDDLTTEGTQVFNISLRTDSINGQVVYTSSNISILDTSTTPPSYFFSSVPGSIGEGLGNTAFGVTTTNISNGTVLYWTIDHVSTAPADFLSTSGSVTVNSNNGQFTVAALIDSVTEGSQSFRAQLRTGSVTGPIVAVTPLVRISDLSLTPATYNITTAPPFIIEGQADRFTVTTTDVPDTTVLYWTIDHITTTAADFEVTSGNFAVFENLGSFVVTTVNDTTQSIDKNFRINIRVNSILGTIVETSGSIIIRDVPIGSAPVRYITNTITVTGGGLFASPTLQAEFLRGSPAFNPGVDPRLPVRAFLASNLTSESNSIVVSNINLFPTPNVAARQFGAVRIKGEVILYADKFVGNSSLVTLTRTVANTQSATLDGNITAGNLVSVLGLRTVQS